MVLILNRSGLYQDYCVAGFSHMEAEDVKWNLIPINVKRGGWNAGGETGDRDIFRRDALAAFYTDFFYKFLKMTQKSQLYQLKLIAWGDFNVNQKD